MVATGGVGEPALRARGPRAGKIVATANKETLVAGGHLVMPLARAAGRRANASDPGHAAWRAHSPGCVPSTRSTRPSGSASSGEDARRRRAADPHRLGRAVPPVVARTPETVHAAQALAHPTWRMGAQDHDRLGHAHQQGAGNHRGTLAVRCRHPRSTWSIHPQSIVHSLVEFVDGSLKAQLGLPDMRIPIQYALTFPHRRSCRRRTSICSPPEMTFDAPDEVRFPRCASLAKRAAAGRGRARRSSPRTRSPCAIPWRHARLRGIPASCVRGGRAVRPRRGEPGLEELIALDAEVRAWADAGRGVRP